MPNICLWGTSCKKVGDEAQMLSVCQVLKSTIPNLRLTIFVRHGEIIQKQHPKVETMPTAHLLKVLRKMMKSDLFIIVGGPFMESLPQMLSCSILVMAAKIFRRPVISFGTTVLPYMTPWGKFFFRQIFNGIHEISVREDASYEILQKLNIKTPIFIYGDPRYVLQPSTRQEVRDILRHEGINLERPIIGITLRHMHAQLPDWVKRSHGYTEDHVETAYDVIGKTLNSLGDDAQVVVLPMHPQYEDDVQAAETIQSRMKNSGNLKILSRSLRAPELMGIIRECGLLIACRLASAIFSTATGTPIVAIAYEPRLVDHMTHIGFGACVMDWRTLNDDFVEMARDTWLSRDSIARQMDIVASEVNQVAWRYSDFVRRCAKSVGMPTTQKSGDQWELAGKGV